MQKKGRAAEAGHQNSSSNNNNHNDMKVDGDRWKEQKTTHGQLAAHAIIPIVVLPWVPRRAKKGSVCMYVFLELYVSPLQIKARSSWRQKKHFASLLLLRLNNTL
jgi:hypothetical protein